MDPASAAGAVPRPLIGEPVALDLLNTRWVAGSEAYDLLESLDGMRVWLGEAALAPRFAPDHSALVGLRHVREVLGVLVAEPTNPEATAALNEVLAHGQVRRTLSVNGPDEAVEFDDPTWGPAWTAADNYLHLLREAPDRIRRCAHPDCVLYFFDTSKNGTRRWCSMAGCGNRAKAARYQARNRRGGRTS